MKTTIKHGLARLGVFFPLDLVRRIPETIRWVSGGCSGAAPHPVKRLIIFSYLKKYGLKQFIETGTLHGDTLAYIARHGTISTMSIELSDTYFSEAQRRFAEYSNVTLLHGDSCRLIPDIVSQSQTPALFWLDGHYSGGDTGKGELETPVSLELEAILASQMKRHVILIDDAHCFDGTGDYPYLDHLLKIVRIDGNYNCEISADIIRLTPKC